MLSPRIGVLALQGDFAAHLAALRREGIVAGEVRYSDQLGDLDGLVLPGGESTTLLRLIVDLGLERPIRDFHASGGSLFGTCAGAILLARRVRHPEQASFELIDIDVERNGWGRQRDSFEAEAASRSLDGPPLPLVFIRAPRIRRVGPGVEVLLALPGPDPEPILVRQGRVLAGTFHPELTPDGRIHRLFGEMAASVGVTAS